VPFLASALTFDALLAAVPFLLLLLVGLTALAQAMAGAAALGTGPVDPNELFHRFLPPHETAAGADPFAVIERILTRITERRSQISLVAVPAFVWFSTRLFAGVRTALNEIYDVSVRPSRPRHPVIAYLRGKLRDAGMVLATLLLFLGNTAVTASLAYGESRGALVAPHLRFWVTWLGRLMGEGLAFAFQLVLFYVVYRYASLRRIPGRIALIASVFSAVCFEIAKRLYGLYLAHIASFESMSGDGQVGAVVLFVLWVYYTAIVFLVGGVVAEMWDLRTMQTQQRGRLD
jgi:membrane protein